MASCFKLFRYRITACCYYFLLAYTMKTVHRGRKYRTRVCGMLPCRACSVILVLILAVTLFMTRIHWFVMCWLCGSWHVWYTLYPSLGAVKTHTGKSLSFLNAWRPCLPGGPACLGLREVELETRPTDATVCGTCGTGPVLGQNRICDTSGLVDVFL